MKLKNKLFILLFVFISLFLVLNIKVFAASGDFESIENFQISDTLEWNTIKEKFTTGQISIFDSFDYHFITKYYNSTKKFNIISISSIPLSDLSGKITYTGYYYIYVFDMDSNTITKSSSYDFSNVEPGLFELDKLDNLIFSSVNIYNESGELVFQAPPQAEPTILAPIVEGTQTQKTLAEILGILPKILVILVSLIGLRKALKMLSTVLNRS